MHAFVDSKHKAQHVRSLTKHITEAAAVARNLRPWLQKMDMEALAVVSMVAMAACRTAGAKPGRAIKCVAAVMLQAQTGIGLSRSAMLKRWRRVRANEPPTGNRGNRTLVPLHKRDFVGKALHEYTSTPLTTGQIRQMRRTGCDPRTVEAVSGDAVMRKTTSDAHLFLKAVYAPEISAYWKEKRQAQAGALPAGTAAAPLSTIIDASAPMIEQRTAAQIADALDLHDDGTGDDADVPVAAAQPVAQGAAAAAADSDDDTGGSDDDDGDDEDDDIVIDAPGAGKTRSS